VRLPRRPWRNQESLPTTARGTARRSRPNADIALWNLTYIQAAIEQLTREGWDISEADIARVSPLLFKHINFLGRYAFDLPQAITEGALS
jgi:Tn3 transposase DDE domain